MINYNFSIKYTRLKSFKNDRLWHLVGYANSLDILSFIYYIFRKKYHLHTISISVLFV